MQTIVYINLHPNYDYAMAAISEFVELRQFVVENDYLCWMPGDRGKRQLMIKRTLPGNIEKFITFVKEQGCLVKLRNERGEDWYNG